MQRTLAFFRKISGMLQLYDTSLGADIQSDCVHFIKIQKSLIKYKIQRELTIRNPEEISPEKLPENLVKVIVQNKLDSTYINLVFPDQNILIKKIEIPTIKEGDILKFLYQHPEYYLDVELDLQKMSIQYYIISKTAEEIKLFILLKRTDQYRQWWLENKLQALYLRQHFRITCLVFLSKIFDSNYTGYLIDFSDETIVLLEFTKGQLSDFVQFGAEEHSKIFQKLESNDNLQKVILAGCNRKTTHFKNSHVIPHLVSLKQTSSEYLNAYSASLIPFIEKSLFIPDKGTINQENSFFKHLTLKCGVIWGFSGFISLVLSLVAFFILSFYVNEQNNSFRDVQASFQRLHSRQTENKRLLRLLNVSWKTRNNRTHLAFYTYRITELMSGEIWLSQILISSTSDKPIEFVLIGFVTDDKDINNFLRKLEQLQFCRTLSLEKIESVPLKKSKLKPDRKKLAEFKFQVRIHV